MANSTDQSAYYVPASSWYPVWLAGAAFLLVFGLGSWLNDLKAGAEPTRWVFFTGLSLLACVLYAWFVKVIDENRTGLASTQVKQSYVWGMGWFIFSEVMFFFAFFGALFYARVLAVSWLGGEGAKGLTGDYLWPDFAPDWPVVNNPDPSRFANPGAHMGWPGFGGLATYLPFYNTVILLSSSVTVHWAHTAMKSDNRRRMIAWLGLTVVLGVLFLTLQVEEYAEAYEHMGLTLGSGIYGSTFFLLTGFHGFHVTLGTFMLSIQLLRAFRGHFSPNDQFGFEASSWYWHFVDVVWVGLFLFVYVL